jgi:hypothetical protein
MGESKGFSLDQWVEGFWEMERLDKGRSCNIERGYYHGITHGGYAELLTHFG